MKTAYCGEQVYKTWHRAWLNDTCETLQRVPARNNNDPMKNVKRLTRACQELRAATPDITYADLKDLAKAECGRLNLAYDIHVLIAAIDASERERKML